LGGWTRQPVWLDPHVLGDIDMAITKRRFDQTLRLINIPLLSLYANEQTNEAATPPWPT
jgi:hypothetical protein